MRYPLLIIAFILSITSYCQNNVQKDTLSIINQHPYFHNYNIENFFLHTNKSLYFNEESIFFKAYVVYDNNNKPNLETRNLHINLYDPENKLVSSQLFYVEDGKSFGSIKLPIDLKSGEYTLQLDTQWNRNFKEGSNFSIIVKNLNEADRTIPNFNTERPLNTNKLDQNNLPITFFTKSGILLQDTQNTIYFKIKSKDDAVVIGAVIDDKTGVEVSKIVAIDNDYAKCNFFYNSSYTAIFYLDNKEKLLKLAPSNKTGFILLKANSKSNEFVNFQLETNQETISNKEDKEIHALLHKKGYLKTKASLNLSDNILNYSLNILKTDLFDGLNTLSIFDNEHNLLAEKKFYHKKNKQINISAKIIEQKKDSVTIDLKLINNYKNVNVSISVIHEESEVIDYDSKITTTLIEKDKKFNTPKNINPNFKKDLFNNSLIYQTENRQNLRFNKEFGTSLKGHLNGPLKDPTSYQVTLSSGANEIFSSTPLSEDKKFKFEKLLLTHPSEFALLLLNKNGRSKEATFYIYNLYLNYRANNILKDNKTKVKTSTNPTILNDNNHTEDIKLPLFKGMELLDEVVLDNVINKEEKRIKEIKKENPFLALNTGLSRDYLIDTEKDVVTLEQYLRRVQGIRVVNDTSNVRIINGRMNNSLLGGAFRYIDIVIDNVFISQEIGGLPNPHRPVTDFELISVNLTGLGNGLKHQNGVINLITRRGKSINKKNYVSKAYKTSNGFNRNQEKLTDDILFFPSKASQNAFGTVDWIPDITLKPNTSNTIKIKKPENENVKLIINGISDDGDLIYKVINLSALDKDI